MLTKLEKKFGKYAIPNLMYYMIVLYLVGAFISLINPTFYVQYLQLDVGKILEGQVWRLVTFMIQPAYLQNGASMLLFALELYLYFILGKSLEDAWGAFRFNLYYLSGIICNILAAFILYFLFHMPYPNGLTYVNRSMFFAFAALYPEVQFYLFFIIPVKVKWMAYFYAVLIGLDVVTAFLQGSAGIIYGTSILIALANFIVFFISSKKTSFSPKQSIRRRAYQRELQAVPQTRHRCSVCGRTELSDETLEFRYCSKCEGNYEYCMEHLFSHKHIKKEEQAEK